MQLAGGSVLQRRWDSTEWYAFKTWPSGVIWTQKAFSHMTTSYSGHVKADPDFKSSQVESTYLSVSLAMQPINGNLIHEIAERWNPRTNTFWFPWGEMTNTLDEFSSIMGLPEPKGDPRGPIED
ncbi:hypothetical protein EJ110_NYTH51705 [Nymphaea thermarum]|nr:hypothetical protein EJ110_NYTH51705 [Nymphaea thermarum]